MNCERAAVSVVRPSSEAGEVKVRWGCGQEGGDKVIEVEPEDEIENGSRKVKKVQGPREPSEEERIEHEMTHLPYRNWCRHCVRGRGKRMPHRAGRPGD